MENENLIINVGRQLGSGGRVIATMLAKDFGCNFYDREILNLAAKESGFSEKFFERNDEHKGLFCSFFNFHIPFINDNDFYNNDISEDSLFKFQSDAIRKAAEEGTCVFVGRCADYILRDKKNIVNIFISADADYRIKQICERHKCDCQQARKIISKMDSKRSSYYNYYTGKTWGAAESYDLCINSSILGIEGTEEFIKDFIKRKIQNR